MKFAYALLAAFVLFLIGNDLYLRWAKSVEYQTELTLPFILSVIPMPVEPSIRWTLTRDVSSTGDTYAQFWEGDLSAPTKDAIRDFIWLDDTSGALAITFATKVCQTQKQPSVVNGVLAVCK